MHAYVHEHLQQGYARLTSENKQRLIDYLDLLLYKQEHAAKHT